MLLSTSLARALSVQVGNEFGASLQYVMMAAYFDREALPRLAARFYAQAEEERMHAMKIAHYVTTAGGKLEIPTVDPGQSDFASAEAAIEKALEWELTVTRQINDLMGLAIKESDHLTQNFLQWFVTEQLEEVNSMDTLLRNIKRANGDLLRIEEFVARMGPGSGPAGAEGGGPAAG